MLGAVVGFLELGISDSAADEADERAIVMFWQLRKAIGSQLTSYQRLRKVRQPSVAGKERSNARDKMTVVIVNRHQKGVMS